MIIQAELKCKQTGCEADTCAVDKVIELPSQRFQQFSRALLADYDFIAENKDAIQRDEAARHCLLILDAEGKDGFLVDPQGHNYARYSAFVPNARSLLTPDMGIDRSYLSPAEPWRDESRDEMLRMMLRVDGKPGYTLVLPADEEYLDAVKTYLDIDVFADAMLCDILGDTDCQAPPVSSCYISSFFQIQNRISVLGHQQCAGNQVERLICDQFRRRKVRKSNIAAADRNGLRRLVYAV